MGNSQLGKSRPCPGRETAGTAGAAGHWPGGSKSWAGRGHGPHLSEERGRVLLQRQHPGDPLGVASWFCSPTGLLYPSPALPRGWGRAPWPAKPGCARRAHPCLGEDLARGQLRCQPGPGNQLTHPGSGWGRPAQPTWERQQSGYLSPARQMEGRPQGGILKLAAAYGAREHSLSP